MDVFQKIEECYSKEHMDYRLKRQRPGVRMWKKTGIQTDNYTGRLLLNIINGGD